MPFVYNLSDLAVISGPINIFESIAAGTPTVFLSNSAITQGYRKETFDEMAQFAMLSGGGFEVANLNSFQSVAQKALSTPGPFKAINTLPKINSWTAPPLKQLLSAIASAINWADPLELERINDLMWEESRYGHYWTPY